MDKRRPPSLVFFLFFFITSQTQSFSQTKYLAENYWVENYGKKEGLPEGIIMGITQDRKGYMWMTTPYKLVRFDGYEFKSFSTREQFPELYVHFYPDLIEDRDGIIWTSTIGMGLFSFDPRTSQFTRYYQDSKINPISDNRIRSITEDDKGNIWIGTAFGLNLVTKKNGEVTIKQFKIKSITALLKALDKAFASPPLAAIDKPGDLELKKSVFQIGQTSKLLVVCMGEEFSERCDYGWIENSKGEIIWNVDDKKAVRAGGAAKNRMQTATITLSPGTYKICFKSDDSHSWNKWNEPAPDRPDWWGIHLFQLPGPIYDSIQVQTSELYNTKELRGEEIDNVIQDSSKNIWIFTNAGLDKLTIQENDIVSSEKVPLPAGFFPSNSMVQLDKDRLIIGGAIYNE